VYKTIHPVTTPPPVPVPGQPRSDDRQTDRQTRTLEEHRLHPDTTTQNPLDIRHTSLFLISTSPSRIAYSDLPAMTADSDLAATAPAERVTSTTSVASDYGYPHGHLGHLSEHEETAFHEFKALVKEKGLWKQDAKSVSFEDVTLL
jgi:hypothetical protein